MLRAVVSIAFLGILGLCSFGCSQEQAPTTTAPEVDVLGPVAQGNVPNGPSGNSSVGHLYLFEKDPETWMIVEGGAWGKMRYRVRNGEFDYVFNGHELEPGCEYTLIRYIDPWPSVGVECYGCAMADEDGNVHISGAAPWGDYTNVKIWLVLSADVDCGNQMIGWNPVEYLFEYNLLFIEE